MTAASHNPDEAMLRRLAEMDMAAAEKAHTALMAAEATAEIAEAMRAYQRAARSVRQTLMLKNRLAQMALQMAPRSARDLAIAEELAYDEADEDPEEVAVEERVCDLQDAVGQVIAAAHPGDDVRQRVLLAAQNMLLGHEAERPDFLHHPLEAHIAAHCEHLGLPPEISLRWRDLPPAPWTVRQPDEPEDMDDEAAGPPPLHRSG
ncbi:MAG: hypothetical protein JF588_05650 [Caulobacterales bacterium]|nr:hypothetical protein [Caulobacterales bacterium]